MSRLIVLIFSYVVVLSGIACDDEVESTSLPQDFGQRVLAHVMSLVQFGPRVAGSAAERDAAAYIRDQLRTLGLDVRVEPFEFETFVVAEARLFVGAEDASPKMIGFNPYQGGLSVDAEAVFVEPGVGSEDLAKLELENRLVITADPAPFFPLMFARPRAIAYLDTGEYAALSAGPCSPCRLRTAGDLARHSSANIVASVGSRDLHAKEIIISAHYDSYRESPGADDNASGIGILLELARYFVTQGVGSDLRLKFVAFGAEEAGLVGSRAYMDEHQEELNRCVLVINLDQAGGPNGPSVEMTGGISGVPDTLGENRFPSFLRNRTWEGMDGSWRLVEPRVMDLFFVTNRPEWLVDLIAESAAAINCEVTPTGNMGGDQQVFTQAGIVATSIGTSGNTYHSPEDTPKQLVVDQLAVVGGLTAEITRGAMERFKQERANHD